MWWHFVAADACALRVRGRVSIRDSSAFPFFPLLKLINQLLFKTKSEFANLSCGITKKKDVLLFFFFQAEEGKGKDNETRKNKHGEAQ